MGNKHESSHFLQDCSISSRRGTEVHWRSHSLAPDRPDWLRRTILMLSCPARSSCTFPLPRQLTISKPRDPSSSKRQLHQMAQLKGLMTSALVTSYAHKTWEREQRGTAKNIALGKKKKKRESAEKKRSLGAGVAGLSGEGSCFRISLKTTLLFLINWWKGGQKVEKCEVSVHCPCGRQFHRQLQNWAIISVFDQRVAQNPWATYEIFKVKKNPKRWCLVVAKPK